MILGHVFGIPVEETALVAPAGATTVAVAAIVARAKITRFLSKIRKH
jgi:hypothetical protein